MRLLIVEAKGPSPRWRGDRQGPRSAICAGRTIPALAGRPPFAAEDERVDVHHPRAGGETPLAWRPGVPRRGPSPRWRGDLMVSIHGASPGGTIPALAGRPWIRPVATSTPPDHPRAGGETRGISITHICAPGPSPRWRGDRRALVCSQGLRRTIPALAGRPRRDAGGRSGSGDHPRAGGETLDREIQQDTGVGPSPRWRGDRDGRPRNPGRHRTIPALAGRPRPARRARRLRGDHPRAGGETPRVKK